jgi:Sec-independent protein translocase protein TatA
MFQVGFSEIIVILLLVLFLAPDKIRAIFRFVAGLKKQFKEIETEFTREFEDLTLPKTEDKD